MHGGLQVTPQPVPYTESQSDYILPARQHNEVLTPILGEFLYFDADLFIFLLNPEQQKPLTSTSGLRTYRGSSLTFQLRLLGHDKVVHQWQL